MKINAKIAALTGAALVFGASSVFAQSTETTTTTTTTVTETAITEDGVEYTGYEAEGEIVVEGEDTVIQGTTTDTVTKEYEGYLIVPVETTEETTYTTVIGQPKGRWSASDWFGGKFHFTNKLGSDIVKGQGSLNPKYEDALYAMELGKIYDEVQLDYEAKRLKFQLKPQVGLTDATENYWSGNANNFWGSSIVATVAGDTNSKNAIDYNRNGLTNDDVALTWTDFDWFVEFLPFDIVGINLHHDMYTPGSYLPVADNNVEGGNLSSEGLTVALYPVEKLRITGTLPFDFSIDASGRNWINAEYEDKTAGDPYLDNASDKDVNNLYYGLENEDGYKFNIGFGAEYTIGNFLTIGGTWKDILGSQGRSLGAYFSIIGIPHFNINLGYTWNQKSFTNGTRFDYWELDDPKVIGTYGTITGHHVANLGVAATFGKLDVALDTLFNIISDQSVYDLYAGLGVGYDLVPGTFKFGVKGFGAFDFGTDRSATEYGITPAGFFTYDEGGNVADSDKADILLGASPWLVYTTGRHEFGASMVYEFYISEDDVNPYHFKFPVYWKYTF